MAGSGRSGDNGEKSVTFAQKTKTFSGLLWQKIWKVGRDDHRRVAHAIKVGLGLTLVSLLYLLEPLFEGIGQNAIWAVMTVVVVLEFTTGATLCKGLNRGVGTLLAGLLAFLLEEIAEQAGQIFRAIFIGSVVFVIGFAATYLRFFPDVKKNCDYGVLVFLLTFNMIIVSSYRVSNILKLAGDRFFTIVIGCGICLFVTFLYPIWSGEDLHKSTVSKFEGLAKSLEACVNEYFSDPKKKKNQDKSCEDSILDIYKTILDTKSQDESLAVYARWEPRRLGHIRYPWQQYVKLGVALRRFGNTVVALHGCSQTDIPIPRACHALFKGPCIRLASEISKVLMELARSIKKRRHFSIDILSDHLQKAFQDLNTVMKAQPKLFLGSKELPETSISPLLQMEAKLSDEQPKKTAGKVLIPQFNRIASPSLEFSEALPFAAFAYLLVEIVARLDKVIEEVEQLGAKAGFKEFKSSNEIVVNCETSNVSVAQSHHLPSNETE